MEHFILTPDKMCPIARIRNHTDPRILQAVMRGEVCRIPDGTVFQLNPDLWGGYERRSVLRDRKGIRAAPQGHSASSEDGAGQLDVPDGSKTAHTDLPGGTEDL